MSIEWWETWSDVLARQQRAIRAERERIRRQQAEDTRRRIEAARPQRELTRRLAEARERAR